MTELRVITEFLPSLRKIFLNDDSTVYSIFRDERYKNIFKKAGAELGQAQVVASASDLEKQMNVWIQLIHVIS